MKIVFYQDYLRVGGTESQTLFLAKQFHEAGHEVLVLTNRPGGRLFSKVSEYGLPHHALQKKDLHLNWRAPGLVKKLRSMKPQAVILMGRNANTKGSVLRKALCEATVFSTFRTGRRLPRSYMKSLQGAPMIYCNSEFSSKRLRALGIQHQRVEVHPNACMIADSCESLVQRSQKKAGESIHAVFLAAFVPGKNHHGLIQMMPAILKAVPHLKLHLVGEGPMLQKTEALVKRFGVSENVVFEGYRKDVPELLRQMDLAISPSLEESMPNALVEAQYCGLPVVAYDVAGVDECFLHEESGILVSENDEAAFIQSVISLVKEPERRQAMSQAAQVFAHEKFDAKVRFDAFYNSVLKCIDPNRIQSSD